MTRETANVPLFAIRHALPCRIVERTNRFVVNVEIENKVFRAHINNTGRLHEILIKGRRGFCFETTSTAKTDFRLFAVEEKNSGALIDTQFQMKSFEAACQKDFIPWLKGCSFLRRNARLGNSLIDYLFECNGNPVYLEVKSAVLREGKYAMYPDCPTTRGQRHVEELISWKKKGEGAFVVFMAALPQIMGFKPNRSGDPRLFNLLQKARDLGVQMKALGLYFNPADSFLYLYNPDLDVVILRR